MQNTTIPSRYASNAEKLAYLVGKTLVHVEGGGMGSESMTMHFSDGHDFVATFYHEQNCCENVRIEDVAGDWADLVGQPLTHAHEASRSEYYSDSYDSATWTFYRFSGGKGTVVVRWLGTSNGYYSERVDIDVTSV